MTKIGLAFGAFYMNFRAAYPKDELILYSEDHEDEFDFMIFPGGADINPGIYGHDNLMSSYIPNRDSIEMDAYRHCVQNNIPMLGICRGMQLINALCGGTLVQDLHVYGAGEHPGNHLLFYIDKFDGLTTVSDVNSLHHQGLDKVADGFDVIAEYKEVPEIVVNRERKILCVQFHPEMGNSWGDKLLKEAKDWLLSK